MTADDMKKNLLQFIKFGIVGASNTAISYGIEMLCYYVLLVHVGWVEGVKIVVVSVLAFVTSVTNSYYWNNRYVFRSSQSKTRGEHLVAYLKTMLCYGITGLALAPWLKMWLGSMGFPFWLGSLLIYAVIIPISFVINKFWAFAVKKSQSTEGWK